MTVVSWGCVQEMQQEITFLKGKITKLKKKVNLMAIAIKH